VCINTVHAYICFDDFINTVHAYICFDDFINTVHAYICFDDFMNTVHAYLYFDDFINTVHAYIYVDDFSFSSSKCPLTKEIRFVKRCCHFTFCFNVVVYLRYIWTWNCLRRKTETDIEHMKTKHIPPLYLRHVWKESNYFYNVSDRHIKTMNTIHDFTSAMQCNTLKGFKVCSIIKLLSQKDATHVFVPKNSFYFLLSDTATISGVLINHNDYSQTMFINLEPQWSNNSFKHF